MSAMSETNINASAPPLRFTLTMKRRTRRERENWMKSVRPSPTCVMKDRSVVRSNPPPRISCSVANNCSALKTTQARVIFPIRSCRLRAMVPSRSGRRKAKEKRWPVTRRPASTGSTSMRTRSYSLRKVFLAKRASHIRMKKAKTRSPITM